MSRHTSPSSRGHRVRFISIWGGYYILSWTLDRYYPGSRLRHPSSRTRETDRKGAERFAKKWKIEIENDPSPKPCRHRAPQLAEVIAGTLVYRETKTGEKHYNVKCAACGVTRETKKRPEPASYGDTVR